MRWKESSENENKDPFIEKTAVDRCIDFTYYVCLHSRFAICISAACNRNQAACMGRNRTTSPAGGDIGKR